MYSETMKTVNVTQQIRTSVKRDLAAKEKANRELRAYLKEIAANTAGAFAVLALIAVIYILTLGWPL